MKLHTLAGFDPLTLKPLSPHDVLRRAIRREQIRSRMDAKAAEAHLDEDERRGRWAFRELMAASGECAMAMVLAAPVALAYMVWMAA